MNITSVSEWLQYSLHVTHHPLSNAIALQNWLKQGTNALILMRHCFLYDPMPELHLFLPLKYFLEEKNLVTSPFMGWESCSLACDALSKALSQLAMKKGSNLQYESGDAHFQIMGQTFPVMTPRLLFKSTHDPESVVLACRGLKVVYEKLLVQHYRTVDETLPSWDSLCPSAFQWELEPHRVQLVKDYLPLFQRFYDDEKTFLDALQMAVQEWSRAQVPDRNMTNTLEILVQRLKHHLQSLDQLLQDYESWPPMLSMLSSLQGPKSPLQRTIQVLQVYVTAVMTWHITFQEKYMDWVLWFDGYLGEKRELPVKSATWMALQTPSLRLTHYTVALTHIYQSLSPNCHTQADAAGLMSFIHKTVQQLDAMIQKNQLQHQKRIQQYLQQQFKPAQPTWSILGAMLYDDHVELILADAHNSSSTTLHEPNESAPVTWLWCFEQGWLLVEYNEKNGTWLPLKHAHFTVTTKVHSTANNVLTLQENNSYIVSFQVQNLDRWLSVFHAALKPFEKNTFSDSNSNQPVALKRGKSVRNWAAQLFSENSSPTMSPSRNAVESPISTLTGTLKSLTKRRPKLTGTASSESSEASSATSGSERTAAKLKRTATASIRKLAQRFTGEDKSQETPPSSDADEKKSTVDRKKSLFRRLTTKPIMDKKNEGLNNNINNIPAQTSSNGKRFGNVFITWQTHSSISPITALPPLNSLLSAAIQVHLPTGTALFQTAKIDTTSTASDILRQIHRKQNQFRWTDFELVLTNLNDAQGTQIHALNDRTLVLPIVYDNLLKQKSIEWHLRERPALALYRRMIQLPWTASEDQDLLAAVQVAQKLGEIAENDDVFVPRQPGEMFTVAFPNPAIRRSMVLNAMRPKSITKSRLSRPTMPKDVSVDDDDETVFMRAVLSPDEEDEKSSSLAASEEELEDGTGTLDEMADYRSDVTGYSIQELNTNNTNFASQHTQSMPALTSKKNESVISVHQTGEISNSVPVMQAVSQDELDFDRSASLTASVPESKDEDFLDILDQYTTTIPNVTHQTIENNNFQVTTTEFGLLDTVHIPRQMSEDALTPDYLESYLEMKITEDANQISNK